jgi:ferredoxin
MAETYTVEIHHRGATHTIAVPDNQTVLDVANDELGLDLPGSCRAGVCTTCAAKLSAGTVDQVDGMGISAELQAEGYALLCVAYPRSNLNLETEQEDTVYNLQFGQPQKK